MNIRGRDPNIGDAERAYGLAPWSPVASGLLAAVLTREGETNRADGLLEKLLNEESEQNEQPVFDGRAWVGVGAGHFVELAESRADRGYYFYAVHNLVDSEFYEKSRRPIEAGVLNTRLDQVLKLHGFTAAALKWSECTAADLLLITDEEPAP